MCTDRLINGKEGMGTESADQFPPDARNGIIDPDTWESYGFRRRTRMFGTIGHARLKPGADAKLDALMEDWTRQIRPTIPGSVLQLTGAPKDRPGEVVFIALMQDEATYRSLADDPAQDAWYRRFMELIEGDVSWEDVDLEITLQD
jgi:hypothetical protein